MSDLLFENATLLFALIIIVLLLYMIYEMYLYSEESRTMFGWEFIFSNNWEPK